MNRTLLALALMVGLVGSAQAQDSIFYFDRAAKKEQEYRGLIESESPAGITIKVREGKDELLKKVATDDIVQVFYQQKQVDRLTYRTPFARLERATKESGKAREKTLLDALAGFSDLEKQFGEVPNARRYMQFKVAEVTALLAQQDPTQLKPAIQLLTEFKTAHPISWQVVPTLKTLARLQEEAGDIDEARKSYEELADLPDIPVTLKRDSDLFIGRLLLRTNKYAEAEKRLKKLEGTLSAAEPQTPFVKAYLVACKLGQKQLDGADKQLIDVLKSSNDVRLRALTFNLLGDYYVQRGQLDEAFWQYLRVETMYPDDLEEHAKALYHLVGLFDKVKKDPLRGKECADKLRSPIYAGTTYQRRLLAESK